MEQSAVVARFGGAQPSHPCGLSQRSQMPHGLLRRWGICRVPSFGLRERVNDLTISSCTARERAWSFVKPGAELKETLSFFFFSLLRSVSGFHVCHCSHWLVEKSFKELQTGEQRRR